MSLAVVEQYSSIASTTWRDYIHDGLISAVEMPGSCLRDKGGNVIAHPRDRKLAKILLDKADVDRLIDSMKGNS